MVVLRFSPVGFLLILLRILDVVTAFSAPMRTHHHPPPRRCCCFGTSFPSESTREKKHVEQSESNFWYSTVKEQSADDSSLYPLPHQQCMDAKGMLPRGSYMQAHAVDRRATVKPLCRVQMKWNDDENNNNEHDVSLVHQCIEEGLTTFQTTGTRHDRYKELIEQTPKTLLDRCSISIPFDSSEEESFYHPFQVRSQLHDQLLFLGVDSLDVLQITIPASTRKDAKQPSSMLMYLELLDHIHELQREGTIRSISVCASDTLVQQLVQRGCRIDTQQCNVANLLHAAETDNNIPSWWKIAQNPFARDDWLLRSPSFMTSTDQWTVAEWESWNTHVLTSTWGQHILQQSGQHRSPPTTLFATQILQPLETMALCHGVSVRHLVLRGLLQKSPPTMVAVPLLHNNPSVRSVFQFALEEEAMQTLNAMAGCSVPNTDDDHTDWMDYAQRSSKTGLYLPKTTTTRA